VVLATKYTNAFRAETRMPQANQRKNMMQAVEASLKRLKTDYIDLYWVHIWDQITPVEEVMRGLDDLVRAGKVLYTGLGFPYDIYAKAMPRAICYGDLRDQILA
jgi:aryl-alcohol dehydrogenase-like predicted oxidoreductase